MTDVSRQSINVTAPFSAGIFPSLSRFVFQTTANSVTIHWGDNLALSAATSQLSVYTSLDASTWSLAATVTPVPNGTAQSYTSTVSLPSGIQYAEIVNGPNAEGTSFGQDYWDGTQVTSATFPNCTVNVPDTPSVARRFVIGTSSIEAGFYGVPASQYGLCADIRMGLNGVHQYPGSVVCDAFSGGAIFHDFGGPVMSGNPSLTFSASAHTIVRNTGSFVSDGFTNADPIWVSGSVSNNGSPLGTLLSVSGVSATTLTFTSGIVNEGPVSGVSLWGPNAINNLLNEFSGIGTITDWLLEPTNDWPLGNPTPGAGGWCAAGMQTGLATALASVHAVYPSATFWLMGSIQRSGETGTNSCGDNLDSYRTALSNVAAALPSYVHYFNAKSCVPFTSTYYVSDFVHLTNAGQATLGQCIATAVGF